MRILFGSPGSGKGTQAKLLAQCLGVPHISTGDMLRERIRDGDEIGTTVAATMHAGALVSDDVVNQMVEERLSRAGLPRRDLFWMGIRGPWRRPSTCAAWLDERGIREVVIHLAVDYNIIIARLTGRRECPRCGTLYNVASHPPKVDGVCDLDGREAGDSGRRPAKR